MNDDRQKNKSLVKYESQWICCHILCFVLGPMTSSRMEPVLSRLFDTIQNLVATEKYVVGQHAVERLEERRILEWQVVAGLDEGLLIVERPEAAPNPVVEVRQSLPDGTELKAVWSYLPRSGVAKLVTVHFFDWI